MTPEMQEILTLVIPPAMVCVLSGGLAIAFLSADYKSPASRALSLAFACISLSIALNIVLPAIMNLPTNLLAWFSLPEAIAIFALSEWVLRVRRTLPSDELDTRLGDRLLRASQITAVVYFLVSIFNADKRQGYFHSGVENIAAY